MKKLILLFFVAAMCVGCPGDDIPYYHSVWYVKNSTSNTISIQRPPNTEYIGRGSLAEIPAGAGVEFHEHREYETMPYFNMLLRSWKGWTDENIALEVLSTDGTLLKTWKYSERDVPGKQFFNEVSWRHTSGYDEGYDEVLDDWFFEITNSDIQ